VNRWVCDDVDVHLDLVRDGVLLRGVGAGLGSGERCRSGESGCQVEEEAS